MDSVSAATALLALTAMKLAEMERKSLALDEVPLGLLPASDTAKD